MTNRLSPVERQDLMHRSEQASEQKSAEQRNEQAKANERIEAQIKKTNEQADKIKESTAQGGVDPEKQRTKNEIKRQEAIEMREANRAERRREEMAEKKAKFGGGQMLDTSA